MVLTEQKNVILGGHFASATGGHFESAKGGQFAPKQVVILNWN